MVMVAVQGSDSLWSQGQREGRRGFHQVISELSKTKTSGLLSLDFILLSNQHQSFGGANLPDFHCSKGRK